MASKRYHHGLTFSDLDKLSVPVVSTMTIDDEKKLSMKGNLAVETHEGSYKYDNEVVLTVWSYVYPTVEVRTNNRGYGRMETVIPGGLREARDFFFSVACELDRKLKGL